MIARHAAEAAIAADANLRGANLRGADLRGA
ncbi:pentapeptide repeat-containing protein, partial [Acinetobacter seifertii]